MPNKQHHTQHLQHNI